MKYSWIFFLPIAVLTFGCGRFGGKGTPQEPARLPADDFRQLADIRGLPAKLSPEAPPIFLVSIDNQTMWNLSAARISITKKGGKERREYIGYPYTFSVSLDRYSEADVVGPKSPGAFVFQIGSFLNYEETKVPGSSWKKEFSFEDHDWKLEAVVGYK